MSDRDDTPAPGRARSTRRRGRVRRVVGWLFGTFGLLLITNVVLSWYLQNSDPTAESAQFDEAVALSIAEAVDTVLVFVAFVLCRKEISAPRKLGARRWLGWSAALPTLAILLLVNFGYHHLLRSLAGISPEADELSIRGNHRVWLLVLTCVQPAVVEELFFRRLAFDFFCNATSAGTAAFVSAIMFAGVHTGGFLSIPYLVLFGFCLAWLRWFTGSLALTMALHFLHNLLISFFEY